MHHPPAFDSWTRPLTNLNPNLLPHATPVNYVVHRRLTSDSDLPATYNILRPSRVLATLPPKARAVLARLSSHLGSPVLCFVHLLALTLLRRHHHPPIPLHLVLVRTASLYIGRRCSLSAVLPVPLCSSLHSDLYRTLSVYRCVPTYLSHHPGWSCPPPRWRLPTSRYLHFRALLCSVPSCLTVPRSLSWSLSSSALFPQITLSAIESWTGRRALPSQPD
ncbi:hypothetical protein BGZ61DRAFT_114519 [Ilyonectria robusta]|uniref:uncharacterized protein n=1 Tax=Ilyonectria robusta TaxID=1079257 RepID=UPI001E8EDECC|nr:uncharacterized protein BGZ61DRAFT_114519 [Ilyonectria robusta]KAH8670052.1 hypothetical protein BGZ61DRAFT_114519 [Ilyonectria robusta]